jgi:hypothetical protein
VNVVDQQCRRLAERYARQVGATGLRKIRQQNSGMPEFSITTFSMTAPCEGIFDAVTVDVTFRSRSSTKRGNIIQFPIQREPHFAGAKPAPCAFKTRALQLTRPSEAEIAKGKAQLATAK